MLHATLVLALVAAPAFAQRTWVIDAANGAGTDFTDLPPAVAAATAGDLLSVRQGTYTGFATNKGLRIVSLQPSTLTWNNGGVQMTVANLPAGETFSMHGFDAPRRFPFVATLTSNAGRVVLSALRSLQTCGCGPLHQNPPSFAITDCVQVSLDECVNYGGPAVSSVRSNVVLTNCQLGFPAPGDPQGDCLYVEGGEVEVADCVLDGRAGSDVNANPRPAVRMLGGTLRLRGIGSSYVQGGWDIQPLQPAPAIDAIGGALVFDPDVPLNPQAGANIALMTQGTQVSQRHLAAAIVRSAAIGGTFRVDLRANGGASAALFLSLPMAPVALPPLGTLWADPATLVLLASGQAGNSGALISTFPLPPALPIGAAIGVQGIADCGTGFELSSPAVTLLR